MASTYGKVGGLLNFCTVVLHGMKGLKIYGYSCLDIKRMTVLISERYYIMWMHYLQYEYFSLSGFIMPVADCVLKGG
jgi:hypothetical protein